MQSTLEFPKGSGILIRPVVNKTKKAAFGQSFIVILPLDLSKEVKINIGKPNERRIPERKQFATLQEAKNHASERHAGHNAVGSKFLDMEHRDRDASVRLLDAIKERGGEAQSTVDDVIAALKLMGTSQAVNLAQCVQFALPRLAPVSGVVTVTKCAESYLETLPGQVSSEHERTMKVYLSRVTERFGDLPVSHLNAPAINEFIGGLRKRDKKGKDGKTIPGKIASGRFRAHVLGAVRLLVRHAVSRGWIAKGVVDFEIVDAPRKKTAGPIAVYNSTELWSLLAHADSELVPFLTIGCFAGLRPAEIERLRWEHVDLVEGFIEVTAQNAKTASRRIVPLLPNLKAWLTPIHKGTGRVFQQSTTGGALTERLHKLARSAGVGNWRKNAPRHSYISNRIADVQNVNQVALESGNSPTIIFSNYRSVVTPAEAKKYFAIFPASYAENVVTLANHVAQ